MVSFIVIFLSCILIGKVGGLCRCATEDKDIYAHVGFPKLIGPVIGYLPQGECVEDINVVMGHVLYEFVKLDFPNFPQGFITQVNTTTVSGCNSTWIPIPNLHKMYITANRTLEHVNNRIDEFTIERISSSASPQLWEQRHSFVKWIFLLCFFFISLCFVPFI